MAGRQPHDLVFGPYATGNSGGAVALNYATVGITTPRMVKGKTPLGDATFLAMSEHPHFNTPAHKQRVNEDGGESRGCAASQSRASY